MLTPEDVAVSTLGPCTFDSPLRPARDGGFVPESTRILWQCEVSDEKPLETVLSFEKAGPRARLFFDPSRVTAAIVTCGGLCPGLNNVIRSATWELIFNYGVRRVLGIRYGYQGLNPAVGLPPVELTSDYVERIHYLGGTVLGSSRGNQDPAVIVDFLQSQGIDMLFCVGGDGTQRGAHAIVEEVRRRQATIAIVGVPKTIDNDICYCQETFGYQTAIEYAQKVIDCAHVEAKGAPRGIGLVKVMGRAAGFIAAGATLASQQVNFTLVPEVPFALDGPRGLLQTLAARLDGRGHAVIVVAEGAGQELFQQDVQRHDASGNVRFDDVGTLLKSRIVEYFKQLGKPVNIKYIDPSYIIRSVPANCQDSILCDQLARRAVHAAMAGKTDVMIGHWNNAFIHVPIPMAIGQSRQMDPEGELWTTLLGVTGQPREMR